MVLNILKISLVLNLLFSSFPLDFFKGNKNLSFDKNEKEKNVEKHIIKIEKINQSLQELYKNKSFWWIDSAKLLSETNNIQISRDYDSIFNKRIKKLDKKTPIKLEYNEFVFNYIEAYAVLNKDKLENIMGLSSYYFPIFEEYLAQYNLPLELKHLASVESALDPNAVSVSGAVGLWQFMKHTSDVFGLIVNSYIDQRRDVYKSTEAACAYLEYLYRTFNDWQLALAAYNGGPGMVIKAITKSGGKTNYWDIRPYLTGQMQNYVPAFIAMTYLMNYHKEHGIFPSENIIDFYSFDTLHIKGPLYFNQIESVINFSGDSIKMMNPVYTKEKIPQDNNIHTLVLPRKYLVDFLISQNEIYSYQPHKKNFIDLKEEASDTTGRFLVIHKVKRGETLHQIAINYRVTVKNIFAWNDLPENYILRFDDTLKIWVDDEKNIE